MIAMCFGQRQRKEFKLLRMGPNALGGFEHPPFSGTPILLDANHNPIKSQSSPSRDCSEEHRRQTSPIDLGTVPD
jgi:hypothetical protein